MKWRGMACMRHRRQHGVEKCISASLFLGRHAVIALSNQRLAAKYSLEVAKVSSRAARVKVFIRLNQGSLKAGEAPRVVARSAVRSAPVDDG